MKLDPLLLAFLRDGNCLVRERHTEPRLLLMWCSVWPARQD